MNIRLVGSELFHADRQTDRRTGRQADRRTDGRTEREIVFDRLSIRFSQFFECS